MTSSRDAELERLVHGVLWPGFLGASAPDWLLRARDAGLAGAVLFAQNVVDGPPAGVGAAVGDDAFLLGIDEEGGSVTRAQARGGSTLPSAAQLGRLDDSAATRTVATALGGLAARVGANLVAAPVADVNVASSNPVIGARSFGADPALVSRHVAAAVDGLADAGALACAKHWPGHGDTLVDSHHGLATSAAARGETERIHVPPFAAAIAAGVQAIMTAHVVVPEWHAVDPATLSADAVGRLRALGFDGAIVTDALDMRAVRRLGIGVAAVRSLAAGCDLLCVGNPANPGSAPADETFALVVAAIVDAVRSGALPADRLEAAHERVERLRALAVDGAARRAVAARTPMPDALAARVVRDAIAVGDAAPVAAPRTVIDARPAPTWAVATAGVAVAEALAAGGAVVVADDASAAAEAATASGPVVVLADRLSDVGQRAIVDAVVAARADAVVVDLGVAPVDEPRARVVRAFGTSRVTADVLADVLAGAPAEATA